MADVIPFKPDGEVGDGMALDPDKVIAAASGVYQQVVIVGFDRDGEIDMRSSHGSREALWILHRAIIHLMTETC